MGSNSFGRIFQVMTFGESHGPGVGAVIDGCPAGLPLSSEEIDQELARRRPGQGSHVSPRKEEDRVEILSGVFEGKTTGAPIALLIRNKDADPSQYEEIKDLYRPGHANFTYLQKYGLFDHRGGGRASARETAARVAAGAVAKKFLAHFGIDCVAYIEQVGEIQLPFFGSLSMSDLREKIAASPLFCPDAATSNLILEKIAEVKAQGDSLGAIIACTAHLPTGLGEPVYSKLEAELAAAMLSIPATKGFEIGSGFRAATLRGSEHNDAFAIDERGFVFTQTNHAGGTLGGISTGAPLFFRVAFKPTSSIQQPQLTVNLRGEQAIFKLPKTARHDPCVALRAVPIVEAMTALVLADALLMNRSAKL